MFIYQFNKKSKFCINSGGILYEKITIVFILYTRVLKNMFAMKYNDLRYLNS